MTSARAIPFTAFCTKVLRLRLTRGQRVLAAVALDGMEPRELEGEDREIARRMFGEVDTIPPMARRILVLVLGRGSGKTTLAAAYALYAMLTADVSACGPGDVPHVVVIAPRRQTAQLAVRMALEMARSAPDLARLLESETADGFTIRRPDNRLAGFAAFAASRGGASARGLSILLFLLDEAQFFLSDDDGAFVVNDRDVYRALIPRLMKGGKGIFISTPWPTETLMGELFEGNFAAPATALAAKAPTLVMRDGDPELAAIIEMERERDAENCAREFDCDVEFTTGSRSFFDGDAIRLAVDVARPLILATPPGALVAAGADLAFASDSSALALVARTGDTFVALRLDELRPSKGAPLRPRHVIDTFAAVMKDYRADSLTADSHYRESAREHLVPHRIRFVDAPGGRDGKTETYLLLRKLLHEGRLSLPSHPRLLAQLRAIVSRPMPGGGFAISSPRRAGVGHGDLVSALVLAVWAAKLGATSPRVRRFIPPHIVA